MARQTGWEEINDTALISTMPPPDVDIKRPPQEDGVQIFVRNNYIYVVTDHEIPVRVFSILGDLIGEGKLHHGVYRMPIKARGIYIVKAGTSTLRVTL